MAQAENEILLHQYTEQAVEQISPYKLRSNDIKSRIDDLEVNDADGVKLAKDLKKEITTHEKLVEGDRKSFTTQLDKVKSTFIAKEREVLEPLVEARKTLSDKVVAYETEQERLAAIEQDRQRDIIKGLVENGGVGVHQIRSLKDLAAYEEKFEARIVKLKEDDAKLAAVISVIADVRTAINERRDTIRRLDKESTEAKQNDLERQADQARAEKQAAAARKEEVKTTAQPKAGVRTRMSFEIVNPDSIPRELCEPSPALIRAYINENNLEHLDGVLIKRERVL